MTLSSAPQVMASRLKLVKGGAPFFGYRMRQEAYKDSEFKEFKLHYFELLLYKASQRNRSAYLKDANNIN
jgi:hypothetical protein